MLTILLKPDTPYSSSGKLANFMQLRSAGATTPGEWLTAAAVELIMVGLVRGLVVRAVGVAASMALGFLVLLELLSLP